MRILDLEPVANPGGGPFRTEAIFCVELSPHIRVSGMRLVKAPDGRYLAYGPNGGGKRCVSFSKEAAAQIAALALRVFEDSKSHENCSITAA